jgi:predicted DNA-binding transcriptional regulator AlpA
MSVDPFKHWKEAKYLTLSEIALLIIKSLPDDWPTDKLLKSQPLGFMPVYRDLLEDVNTPTDYQYEMNEYGDYYPVFELNTVNRTSSKPIGWEDGLTKKVYRSVIDEWLKNNKRLPLFSPVEVTVESEPKTKTVKPKSSKKADSSIVDFDSLPDSVYVRLPTVMAIFACSKSSVLRHINTGRIPKAHKLSSRTVGWNVGELREALAKID